MMTDTSSVSAIKKRLQDLGLSTATPGIVGEERYEELKKRLQEHEIALKGPKTTDASEISIADLRDRLSALGESTSTPGLVGEDRRNELKRRLMLAICGSNGQESDSMADDLISKNDKTEESDYFQDMPAAVYGKELAISAPKTVTVVPPPPKDPPPPSQVVSQGFQKDVEQPLPEQATAVAEKKPQRPGLDLVEPSQAEISERKKLLKRLVNKRALAVAARLSGASQDKELKDSEKLASQADVEITRIKALKQSAPGRTASSVLVDNGMGQLPLDKLLAKLETIKLAAKDQVRVHRVRIREEEDRHPEYGVEAEERLNAAIREVSYIKGRTRRRIDEYKSIAGINDSTGLQDGGAAEEVSPTNNEHPSRRSSLGSLDGGSIVAAAAAAGIAAAGGGGGPGANMTMASTANTVGARASPGTLKSSLSERMTAANIPLPPAISIPSSTSISSSANVGMSPSEFTPKRKLVSPPARRDSTASSTSGVSMDSLTENLTEYNIDMLSPLVVSSSSMTGAAIKPAAVKAGSSGGGGSSGNSLSVVPPPKVAPPPLHVTAKGAPTAAASDKGEKKGQNVASDSKQAASASSSTSSGSGRGSGTGTGIENNRRAELKAQYLSKPGNTDRVVRTNILGDDDDDMFRADDIGKKGYRGGESDSDGEDDQKRHRDHPGKNGNSNGAKIRGDSNVADTKNGQVNVPVDAMSQALRGAAVSSSDEVVVGRERKRGDDAEEEGDSEEEDDDDDDDDTVDQDDDSEDDEEDSGDDENDTEATAAKAAAWMAKRTTGMAAPPPNHHVGGPPSVPPPQHSHPPGAQQLPSLGGKAQQQVEGEGQGQHKEISLTASVAAAAVKKGPQAYIEAAQMLAAADKPKNNVDLVLRDGVSRVTAESAEDIIKATRPSSKPSSAGAATAIGERTKGGMSANEAAVAAASRTTAAAKSSDHADSDDDAEDDLAKQMKALRDHAKVLESVNDLNACEAIYLRALQLDPLEVRTLTAFAVFLHRRRGEMDRAEAFFGRGLQVCLPGLFNTLASSSRRKMHLPTDTPSGSFASSASMTEAANTAAATVNATSAEGGGRVGDEKDTTETQYRRPHAPPPSIPHKKGGPRIKTSVISKLLMSYAGFLTRAQGDIENAVIVYRKAVEISPDNAAVLGAVAHFMAKEGVYLDEALDLFSRALKSDPGNALHALWYAKLLRKKGRIGQAEIMYKVAVQKSKGTAPYTTLNSSGTASSSVEASALCNYATFLYRQRKDPVRAQAIFAEALVRFPFHKGLIKNYSYLLLAHPELNPHPELRIHLPSTTGVEKPKPRSNPYIAAAVDIDGKTGDEGRPPVRGSGPNCSPSVSADGSARTDEDRPGPGHSTYATQRAGAGLHGPMPSPEKDVDNSNSMLTRARRPSFPPPNLHHGPSAPKLSGDRPNSPNTNTTKIDRETHQETHGDHDKRSKKRSSGRRESLKRLQNALAATAQQQFKASSPPTLPPVPLHGDP